MFILHTNTQNLAQINTFIFGERHRHPKADKTGFILHTICDRRYTLRKYMRGTHDDLGLEPCPEIVCLFLERYIGCGNRSEMVQ